MHTKIIPVITRFKLNICDPYMIRYPIPDFDTKNSPIITPMNVRPMFILQVFSIFDLLLGIISLKYIWELFALKLPKFDSYELFRLTV